MCVEPTADLALLNLISLHISLQQLANAHEDRNKGPLKGAGRGRGGAEGDGVVNRF